MSKERTVVEHCEDYANEHGLSAVTDHQYAMRLKARNANLKAKNAELKEELRVGNHLLALATDRQRDLDTEIMQLRRQNIKLHKENKDLLEELEATKTELRRYLE